jgi:hypothetical protein
MKVFTKLVSLDFVLGSMERDGDILLIRSDTEKSIPAEVEMTAQDVVDLVRVALNRSVISFLLQLPFHLRREKEAQEAEHAP